MTKPVAMITGGAQGIGKALTQRFLEEGYQVVVLDPDLEAGEAILQEYAAFGALTRIAGSVGREEDVVQAVHASIRPHGGLDVLVNNAAISHNAPLEQLARAEWDQVLAVNLTGPFLCAKHCAPWLRVRRGTIINLASTRALMSEPGTEAYSASKGGLVALTHALAASLAPDIRVNCISPGWIETHPWQKPSTREPARLSEADHQQHWAGRVGIPEDISSLAAFLASRQSGFITGAHFVVDGGMTRKMIYT